MNTAKEMSNIFLRGLKKTVVQMLNALERGVTSGVKSFWALFKILVALVAIIVLLLFALFIRAL